MKNKVYIVGGTRTPFVKSITSYKKITTQQLMSASLNKLVEKFNLSGKQVGDVGLGAVMLRSSDWNLTRECILDTALHPYTPGFNLQRACGTSLEITNIIALKIASGQIETGIAGGVDTNSDLTTLYPRSFSKKILQLKSAKNTAEKIKALMAFHLRDLTPDFPVVKEPRTGLSMGEHCELMVKEWKISREEQDQWTLESHQKAAKAQEAHFFDDLVFSFSGVEKDGIVRGDTNLQKLSRLKPVFDPSSAGTLTAGNSSALTDGSSCVFLASEKEVTRSGYKPLAEFIDCEVAALDFVHGDGLLMAPTLAVSRLLERNKLNFSDFDFFELHEAFSGQVLCTLKAWENKQFCQKYLGRENVLGPIPREKINIHGGSVAIGHPFAATGTRIVASLGKILSSKKKSRGLISICTAGGMGVAAVMQSVE